MLHIPGRSSGISINGRTARLVHQPPHLSDRGLKAKENRLADKEMPNVQFDHFRYLSYRAHGVVGKSMTGVNLKPQFVGARCSTSQSVQLLILAPPPPLPS